jgi:hypothetical protein
VTSEDKLLATLHRLGSCLKPWPHNGFCTDLPAATLNVAALKPGDLVETLPGTLSIFIYRTAHPIYPSLMLVTWFIIPSSKNPKGIYAFDALNLSQEVGKRIQVDFRNRVLNLRKALGQQV